MREGRCNDLRCLRQRQEARWRGEEQLHEEVRFGRGRDLTGRWHRPAYHMELAMGLLDQVLGGVTGSQSTSSTSPLVKALMLLLAAKAFTSYTQSRSAAPQT